MANNDINVLIIDDDSSIRKSISQAVERAGWKSLEAAKAQEGRRLAKMQRVHVAVVDCMLPGQNGIDLTVEIRETMADSGIIFFITGVYKDKLFAQQSIKKVRAERFFYKPFDVEDLIKAIREKLPQSQVVSVEPEPLPVGFSSFLFEKNLSMERLSQIVSNTGTLQGGDILFLVPNIMKLNGTGTLDIKGDNGDDYFIKFLNGNIQFINSRNSFKTVGRLLLTQNLLTQEEYKKLTNESEESQFESILLNDNWISPHALSMIKREQFFLELKEIFNCENLKVSFQMEEKGESLSADMSYDFIQDIFYKVIEKNVKSSTWLKDFFQPLIDSFLVLKVGVGKSHSVWAHTTVQKMDRLFDSLSSSPTLEEILNQEDEEDFYRALYILVVNQVVLFVKNKKVMGEKKTEKVEGETLIHLKTLLNNIKGLGAAEIFQFLGASSEAPTDKEVAATFRMFSRTNHPDKLPVEASREERELSQKVFSMVSEAHEIMMDPKKRRANLASFQSKDIKSQVQSQELIKKGLKFLRSGQFGFAVDNLEKAYELYESPYTLLYLYWAELKSEEISVERINEINVSLSSFSDDYKKNEHYYFVCGLVHRATDNALEAENCLKGALKINPGFLGAKRELISLARENKEKSQSVFTSDLSSVVSNFFRKKG